MPVVGRRLRSAFAFLIVAGDGLRAIQPQATRFHFGVLDKSSFDPRTGFCADAL